MGRRIDTDSLSGKKTPPNPDIELENAVHYLKQLGKRAKNEPGWKCPICGMKIKNDVPVWEHNDLCEGS